MAHLTLDHKSQLKEYNQHLAPLFVPWLQAFLECSDNSQQVVRDMVSIMSDPEADADDKEMAKATFLEALFPSTHNGLFGADLEEVEASNCEANKDFAAVVCEMDQQETTFGDRVQKVMKSKGITQEQLAEATGVTQPAICMLLNRNARPQQRTVSKIAEALKVDVSEIWPS